MTDFHVSKHASASNSNGGTNETTDAWATVNHGAQQLSAGDRLIVHAGTYTEWLDWWFGFSSGTSWANPVTVMAATGDTVILRPSSSADFVVRVINRSYVIFDGLDLDAVNASFGNIKITWGSGSNTGHHIRFINCEIHNSPTNGALVGTGDTTAKTDPGGFNEFLNCHIHHNGDSDFEHGVYIQCPSNKIQQCDIHDNAGWGVHLWSENWAGVVDDNDITRNTIHDNSQSGVRGAGVTVGGGGNNLVANNKIWGNDGGVAVGFGGAVGNKVFHNTLYNNPDSHGGSNSFGVRLEAATNTEVRNNIIWNNGGQILQIGNTPGTILSGNLNPATNSVDPLFVNAGSLDFSLQATSPCIDAVATLVDVPIDFDGLPRPEGALSDQGALEFASTPSPPFNTVPGSQVMNHNTSLAVGGISVADGDGNLDTIRITTVHGDMAVFLAGGVTISSGANNSSDMTLSGTQADLNTTVASVIYTPPTDFVGVDTLTVVSTDSAVLSDTDNVSIQVNNGAPPVNAIPAPQSVSKNNTLAITSLSVTDADDNLDTVQLVVSNGTLNMTLIGSATVHSGAMVSGSVTLTGPLADINSTLATLMYTPTPDFVGVDSLVVLSTDDLSGSDNDALAITVENVVAPMSIARDDSEILLPNESFDIYL